MNKKTKKVVWMITAVFSLLLLSSAKTGFQTLGEREQRQYRANNGVRAWKASYQKLVPSKEKWKITYKSLGDVQDLDGLHKMLDIEKVGVDTYPLKTRRKGEVKRIEFKGSKIGLNQVCVNSAGNKGLLISSPKFPTLLSGINQLSSRPDIRMRSVELDMNGNNATAIIEDFCILLKEKDKEDA